MTEKTNLSLYNLNPVSRHYREEAEEGLLGTDFLPLPLVSLLSLLEVLLLKGAVGVPAALEQHLQIIPLRQLILAEQTI